MKFHMILNKFLIFSVFEPSDTYKKNLIEDMSLKICQFCKDF